MKITCFYSALFFLIIGFSCQSGGSPDLSSNQGDHSEMEADPAAFKLAMAQMLVEGGNLDANLNRAIDRISAAADAGAELVLLPEVMDLGWTHSSAKTKAFPVPGGYTFNKLAEAARTNDIFVVAGIVEKEADLIYNTAVLVSDEGELLLKHRKLNELDIAHELYSQGDRLNVCHTKLGTIGLMVCADAFADDLIIQRSLGYMGADIILSPSAWAVEHDHDNDSNPYGDLWHRCYEPVAAEFQMWIVGVSNVGIVNDGPWKGWYCIGCSLAIDAQGNEVVQAGYGRAADTIIYINVQTVPRPTRGTGWKNYWKKD